MRCVKDYRNRIKDEEGSSTTQGFDRDLIFCRTVVTKQGVARWGCISISEGVDDLFIHVSVSAIMLG